MSERSPIELLRAAIEAQKYEMPCYTLHELHGDDGGDCSDRSCFECEVYALRKAADLVEAELDALKAQALPDGMEWLVEAWPRFEDGEPVKFGDMALIDGEADMVEAVQLWIHGKPVIYGDGGSQQLEMGERVKRPAPKVLDADGADIRVGDTVWDEHGNELVVLAVYGQDVHCRYAEYEDQICDNGTWEPSQLTHHAPVLAADGRPLREGERVYHVETGAKLVVKELPKPGEYQAVVVSAPPASHITSFDPDQLTHQRPESWERLEEDALKDGRGYFRCNRECSTCRIPDELGVSSANYGIVAACAYAQRKDLVRRAKKLARVEA